MMPNNLIYRLICIILWDFQLCEDYTSLSFGPSSGQHCSFCVVVSVVMLENMYNFTALCSLFPSEQGPHNLMYLTCWLCVLYNVCSCTCRNID